MSRQIFIDTETTGLSAAQGHRIIELAAVETINGQATGRVLHTFLNPQRSIDPYAQAVHGCSAEMLADKPLFSEIASDFIDFVRGAECLMHNAPFDTSFIDAELSLCAAPARLNDLVDITCTKQLARSRFPGEKASLDALLARAGVKEARGIHTALDDAKLLAHVYFTLLKSEIRDDEAPPPNAPITSIASAAITPNKLRMEKVIELVGARQETFFYRQKHKRIIDHRVLNEERWRNVCGPLLYAVTDNSGLIRYVGKWETKTALYSRWIRHDTIHHSESARNAYLRELDAGRGPLEVWSISVKELLPFLPVEIRKWDEVRIASNLEGLWIRRWKEQMKWNRRIEPIEPEFSDGDFWLQALGD